MEYEHALALELVGTPNAICEWVVLGQKDQEVYVYAMCQITDLSIGTAATIPVVIHLGNNGSIEKVQLPGSGTQYGNNIRKMFPPELQDKMILPTDDMGIDKMWSHLDLRQENPEPPLIASSGFALP